ncbi:hypothetical protein [Acinetobacter baumannii]|uniref:hypothetical protein n=1 Tax=Acinetobacter baumannii TaxID=470 RepID=UPI0003DEF7E4|nr:hypothetical protein [Acinetobacter baumannii]ETR52342.1 hypothetical protein P685_1505 [Acinetobacter baumannii UH9007]
MSHSYQLYSWLSSLKKLHNDTTVSFLEFVKSKTGFEVVNSQVANDLKNEQYHFGVYDKGWIEFDEDSQNVIDVIMRLKAGPVPIVEALTLENDCMIGQTWFPKGTPVINLIKHAEGVYKAEAVAQNSKIEFGTDDNEIWWAHDVPFYGRVQLQRFVEHGVVEWDIHFNDCWQGPFDSKVSAIQHLEECIAEKREEEAV